MAGLGLFAPRRAAPRASSPIASTNTSLAFHVSLGCNKMLPQYNLIPYSHCSSIFIALINTGLKAVESLLVFLVSLRDLNHSAHSYVPAMAPTYNLQLKSRQPHD